MSFRDRSPIRLSDIDTDCDSDSNLDNQNLNSPDTNQSFTDLILLENLNFNMTQTNAHAQIQILKPEYLKMIPEFSGEMELLPRFIEISEKLVNKFYNTVDVADFQNEYLMSSIRSKIKGEATLHIANCTINTWEDLKTSLLNAYSDKRDSFTLNLEMSNLKQLSNESPFDFYNKLQRILNLQISYIKTHSSNATEANILTMYFQKYAVRILLRGLREPVGSLMRTKNPPDLNTALNMLTNDFQIEASIRNESNFNKISNQQKPGKPMQNKPNKTNYQFFQSPNFSQNYSNKPYVSNQNQFVPTKINQNQIAQNQNFSNKTNFDRSKVTNSQRQNQNSKFYTPTPMSISTRNTTNQRPIQQNYFRPNANSNQKYLVEELYNLEQTEPDENNSTENIIDDQNFLWKNASEEENMN